MKITNYRMNKEQVLLYNTENNIPYPLINSNGKKTWKRLYMYNELLLHVAEVNITL